MYELESAVLSDHATRKMARRLIPEADVRRILACPDQVMVLGAGRVVAQGPITPAGAKSAHFLRIFVDVDRFPPVVVTAYKTSKIQKYGVSDGRNL